jgi:hypothetical protein
MSNRAPLQDVQKENFGKLRINFHCAINLHLKVNGSGDRLRLSSPDLHHRDLKK